MAHQREENRLPLILLVEDDRRLAELISEYLTSNGYLIEIERRGDGAAERVRVLKPDLVILDLMLPGEDGLSVCRRVRSFYGGPILILTAREDDTDQVVGLEMGADDYVKKPAHPRVLLARVRALLRRSSCSPLVNGQESPCALERVLVFGGLRIKASTRSVSLDGNPVDLTSSEFDLLWILADHAGVILDRTELFRSLRGIDYDGLDRSVDIFISRLRKKLGDNPSNPQRIKTVWGRGYLFVADAWETAPASTGRLSP